jgi:hypothetical protein
VHHAKIATLEGISRQGISSVIHLSCGPKRMNFDDFEMVKGVSQG